MRMTLEQFRQRFPDRREPVSTEYLGQWIAWDENRTKIIAHGEKLSQVATKAKDAGCEDPVMQKIPSGTFVGGQRIALTFADVILELTDEDSSLRWEARLFFAESDGDAEETVILGHQGFLDFFMATFDGEDCSVELQPNDTLPALD